MKRDFDTPLLDLDGSPVVERIADPKGTIKEDVVQPNGTVREVIYREEIPTLKKIVLAALKGTLRGDELLDAKKQCDLIALALKINKSGITELEDDEVTLIKDRVTKLPFGHLPVYRVHKFLEIDEEKKNGSITI